MSLYLAILTVILCELIWPTLIAGSRMPCLPLLTVEAAACQLGVGMFLGEYLTLPCFLAISFFLHEIYILCLFSFSNQSVFCARLFLFANYYFFFHPVNSFSPSPIFLILFLIFVCTFSFLLHATTA